jgi:16S rRNA (cytosine1402-N4)-methyltransferase
MMTAETYHVSVLLKESVDGLDIKPGGIYADMTYGGGGHSKEILRRMGGKGHLYAFDQDADAEKNALADIRQKNFTFVRSNFRYLNNWMRFYGVRGGVGLDGVFADLGVSSHHFDDASRGFSFRFDTSLDMRMNQRGGMTAADVVNGYSEEQLATMFYLYGELKNARRLAAAIAKARQRQPILTTGQLLRALGISGESPEANGQWKKDGAKIFQALRIEVNREMEVLKEMLQAATELLNPGGRLVVITYHSLEDRMVKNMMRSGNVEGKTQQDFFGRVTAPLHIINNKVVTPSEQELLANPRSRSAKLRIAEKIGN